MFRVPLLVGLALIVAFGGGIAFTLTALEATAGFGSIRIGAWVAFPEAQTIEADPYAKSHRADAGKLLYGTAEGLVFTAAADDDGRVLTGHCRYLLSGDVPPSRFFTLYAADERGNLLDDGSGRPTALNSRTVLRGQKGEMDIAIAAEAQPYNWLAVPPGRAFRLVLTLLDSPVAGSSGLIDISMPKLVRTGCGDA